MRYCGSIVWNFCVNFHIVMMLLKFGLSKIVCDVRVFEPVNLLVLGGRSAV